MPVAPAFGEWLRTWAESEAVARRKTPDSRKQSHLLALPPAHLWNDGQLAAGLLASTSLSYCTQPAATGEFIDRVTLRIVAEAAARLEATP